MVGVRFYLEYLNKKDKRLNKSIGNVIAISKDNLNILNLCYDAIGAIYSHRNSEVASTTVHIDYLREKTKRISETKARVIHPNLFAYLD